MNSLTRRRAVTRVLAGSALAIFTGGKATMATAQTGMSVTETQKAIDSYYEALAGGGDFASFFADDIVVSMMDTGQEVHGRVEAGNVVEYLHNIAFEATPEVRTIVYGAGIASAELVFAGRQLETFEGIEPSGQDFRVPYSVVWDLDNAKITSLRIYQFASALVATLTAQAAESSN